MSQSKTKRYAQETIYSPDSHRGMGWKDFRRMMREFLGSRELMWRLFVRDLSARYRQSAFGYLWAVVPAIITVATFTWLKKGILTGIGDTEIAYPAYVLSGLAIWKLFSVGLTKAAGCLIASRNLITKVNFSRETLVFAAFGDSLFNFLIHFVLIVLVFAWYRIVPSWTVVFVPVVLVPLCLMTIGMGFILSLANSIVRDVGSSLSLLMTFGMFLTPVIYPPPTRYPMVLINYLNPVSPFITAARDLTISGTLSQPWTLLGMSIFGIILFVLAWRVFYVAMPRVAERV
ncbi:MAG: ABC transporter permease [Phycisphaerae bacterium]|nr:ABC transporter permease [Phycisphaerae bacterium]